MTWTLAEPDWVTRQGAEWQRVLKGDPNLRDPLKCDHLRRRWRGGIHWYCLDCGEAVRDREIITQKTFDRLFLNALECDHTETFRVCGNVADPALKGQLRCRQCHRPLSE